MKLEICANSFQSAKNAQEAGADRIELCTSLSVGGLTPDHDLIKKVLNELCIETFILIRPRSGNFVYSKEEFETMKQDIIAAKAFGCHGIVSGVLNKDCTLDLARTRALVELSKPLPFTFHRAFDEVIDPLETLDQLIRLDVDRVLSSGQKESAPKGITLLNRMQQSVEEKMIILPGSGILPENVSLFKENGFVEVHASASKPISNKTLQTVSDLKTIKAILKHIK